MARYFKSRKIIRRNQIFKYLTILVIVYLTLKFSIALLSNISFLSNIHSLNKTKDYYNIIKKNTINNPQVLLNMDIKKKPVVEKVQLANKESIENVLKPSVYIYNSHQTETYNDYATTVLDAANLFKEEFNKYNVLVDVEYGSINDFLITNNMDYGYSYIASRYFIEENILNNNYDLIIDLHRDAIGHDASFINIDGKDCAKILFVVGEEHENYQTNLALANYLNDLINSKYPNLSRGVMLKSGPDVNGLYNQDLSEKMILLELGGNNNSVLEIQNTISLITPILGEYLYGNQS